MRKLRDNHKDYKLGEKIYDFTIDSDRYAKNNRGYYWCKCVCGNRKEIRVDWLNGLVKSCGCNKKKYVSKNNPRNKGTYLDDLGNKQCIECLEIKKEKDYPINNSEPDKLNRRCHICRKNGWLLKKYNITLKDYNSLLKEQNFKCACCFKTSNEITNSRCNDGLFFVDHCHTTGNVRGLLCASCNSGIGFLKDDINILNNAINYLNKYREIQ